jgi:hypothetical protein
MCGGLYAGTLYQASTQVSLLPLLVRHSGAGKLPVMCSMLSSGGSGVGGDIQ